MIHLRVSALALLLMGGLVACSPRLTRHEPIIQPTADMDAEAILARFDQRWQPAEALRALARVTVTSAQGRYSTRQTFLWHRPALLRLDTLGLFGQLVMSLIADAVQVSVYYPAEGIVFQGPATAATLARVMGLPLEVEEVAPLLMGYIRPSPAQQVAVPYLQVDASLHLLRFVNAEGALIQDAWVDPDQLLPTRVLRYTQHNMPTVDIAYSEFRLLTDTFPAPFELAIWLPQVETEIRIQFLSVDLNPTLPPTVFHLSPPEGVQVHPLP